MQLQFESESESESEQLIEREKRRQTNINNNINNFSNGMSTSVSDQDRNPFSPFLCLFHFGFHFSLLTSSSCWLPFFPSSPRIVFSSLPFYIVQFLFNGREVGRKRGKAKVGRCEVGVGQSEWADVVWSWLEHELSVGIGHMRMVRRSDVLLLSFLISAFPIHLS